MSKYYAEDELKKMFGGQKSGQKWTDTETALFAPYTDIISKPMSDEYSSMLKGITHRQDEIRQYNESLWKDKKDFDFNITKQDVQKITSEIKAKSKETPYTKVQLLGTSFTIPTEMALSLKGISDILSQAFFSDFAQEAQRESEKNKFTANATELAYKGIKGAFEASQRVLSAPDRINETVERLFKVDENVPRLRATDILTNPGKAMYEGYVTAAAEDNGKFMYHAGNIMEAAGGMVPTLIAGNVLGAAHPVLGKLGSMATIWTTSGASAFDEAQADGKSFWESTAYGMTMGAAEGVLGYFIGGIGTTAKDSTGILGRVLKKPMNALVNATKKVSSSVKVQAAFRVLLNGLADAGSEAIEEFLQETLQNTYQKFIFKKDISWDEGVLTAALYGAVLSSVFNAASMVGSYNTETRQVFEEMGEACKVESDKMFNIMPDLPAEELAQYKQLLETTLGDKTLADIGKIVESRENWIAEVGEENGKYYDDAVKTYERMKTDAATIKLILDKNPLSETEQIKEKIKGKFEPRDLTGTMTEQDVRTAISEVADEIAYLAHTDLDNDIFNQKVIEAQQLKDSADVMGIEIPEGVFSTVVNNIDADPEILKETIRRTSTKPEIPQDASYQEGMQSAKRLQIQGELAKVRSEIEIQKAQADEALRKMNEAAEAVRQDRANKDLLERYKQAKALHDMEQQVRRANERKLKYLIQEEQTLLLPERSSAEAKPEAAAELDVEPEAKPEAVEEVTPEVTPEPAPAQEAGQAEQEVTQEVKQTEQEVTQEVPQNAPQTERKFKIIDRNDTGTLKLREKVKGSLGVDLLYVDTLGGAEAVYSKSEGIIYVANDTALLPWRQIEKVIMHECVHSFQGTLAYDELIAYTANNRPDLFSKDNIAKTQDVYRRAGIELSEAEATQEIAADFLADILGDMDLINTIAAEAPKTSVGIAGWLRTTLNHLTKTAKKGEDTYIKEVMDYQKRLNKAMEEASKKRANPEQQAEKPKMKTSDEILYSTDPYAYEMQFSITPDPTAEQMKEAIRVAREAVRRYGAIPEGATPLLREGDAIVIDGTQYLYPGMPQKISPKQNVSKFIRTVLESNLVTDRQKGQIIRDTMAGTIGVYQAQANKAVMAYAKNVIAEQGSIESATDFFYEQLKTGKNDSKTMAIGIELLQHYFNNNNMETAEKILGDLIVELTEAGRKVQLGNILKQMSGTGQVYTLQKLVNKLNYHKKPGEQRYYLPDWVASELRQPDLTVEQQQDIYDRATAEIINQIPATWWEKWNQWRYLSMLGNPKTHIRNVLGNAVMIPTIMLKNTIAVPLEVAANVAEVKRLTNLSKEASRATTSQDKLKILSEVERSAEYKSLLTRTVEAFKTESDKMNYLNGIAESLEARIKTGQAIERTKAAIAPTALKKFAKQDALRITELLTEGEKYTQNSLFKVVEQKKIFKTKWLEWIRKKNLDLLEAEDLLFLNYHYSNALAGYLHTNGITAQQAAQAVQELSDGKFTKNTDLYLRAQEYAINEAKKATYRDANSLARTLNKFAKESRGQEVLIEAITPFKATPFNIVKRGVEYSPLGIISAVGKTYNAIAKGTVTPTQAIDSMCAGLSGTAIATVGMYLAAQGLLSGLLGDDKEEKLLRQGGKQSFSVNILGNSYTIDWAAPVCMPLFVGVTLWEGISKGGLSLSETIESGLSILEPVFNLTMLQGINRAISSAKYHDRNPLAAVIVNQLGNYGGQGIPTLFGQIARTMSKERGGTRTAYTGALPTDMQYIVQTWLNKIPGIPRNPYIDLWGETSVDPLWERAATNFLSPGYLETQEPLALKMAELQKRTDESVVPIQPPKKITYLGKEYNLTAAEQVEYGKLIGAAQKEAAIEFIENGKKITVQFNNDKGTRISATVTFEQKDTGKTYGGLYSLDDLKARALKKYMQSAKDKAHAQFMKEYLKR